MASTVLINGVQVNGQLRPIFDSGSITTPSAGIIIPIPVGLPTLSVVFAGCVAASGTTAEMHWMLGANAVGTGSSVPVSAATKRTLILSLSKGALNDWGVGTGVLQPHSATGVSVFNVPVVSGSPGAFNGLRFRVTSGAAALSFDAIRVVGWPL